MTVISYTLTYHSFLKIIGYVIVERQSVNPLIKTFSWVLVVGLAPHLHPFLCLSSEIGSDLVATLRSHPVRRRLVGSQVYSNFLFGISRNCGLMLVEWDFPYSVPNCETPQTLSACGDLGSLYFLFASNSFPSRLHSGCEGVASQRRKWSQKLSDSACSEDHP